MKTEAHILILLKRVHQLEMIVEQLITAVGDNMIYIDRQENRDYTPEPVLKARSTLFDAGVPFDPNCNNCKTELRIINPGTNWECFECPDCEAWYFPQVG